MRASPVGPDVQMPTVTGPSPPPIRVVIPAEIASSHSPALSKWTCTSIPPAVTIFPSALRTSVLAPTTRLGFTPSITSGLPALPMATMRPSLIPMSAFTIPAMASTIKAPVSTKSSAPSREVMNPFVPKPSRSVFPPPNTHSSP